MYEQVTLDTHSLQCWRKGEGEPLLFLHGYSYPPHLYPETLDRLSESFEVIAPRMFGMNEFAPQPTNPEEYTDITCEFMEKLDRKNYHVVGHSMGACVATLSAARRNDITDVIGLSSLHPNTHSVAQFIKGYMKIMKNDRNGGVAYPEMSKEEVREHMREAMPQVFRNIFKKPFKSIELTHHLGRFSYPDRSFHVYQPTWYLDAEKDEFFPPTKTHPDARHFSYMRRSVIANRTHMWPVYEPEHVHRIVESFHKEIKGLSLQQEYRQER